MFENTYNSKVRSVSEALRCIKSEDFIFVGQGAGEPVEILKNLHRIKDLGVRGCELNTYVFMNEYEFLMNGNYKDSLFVNSMFYTGPMRKNHKYGNISFVPNHPNTVVADRLVVSEDRRKVLLCTCSPMDRHGYMSLSLSTLFERDIVNAGAVVVAEVNPNLPRTFGDTLIHIDEIEAVVEVKRPIPQVSYGSVTEKDLIIAGNVAELVDDGSTLQFGIGRMPDALAHVLKNKKHLGIHSDIFTDSMVDLIISGAVDNSMKTLYKGKSVAASALGTDKLYNFIDDNPSFLFRSTKWVNDPYIISRNHKMTSINTSLEIDVSGQCASESIGSIQFSGTGGQANTAIGAQMAMGGKSIIALPATAKIKDENGKSKTISKIVTELKTGTAVSLTRNDVDYVVTEFGIASLRGQSLRERVRRLINIADPYFKDELKFSSRKNGIL